MVCDACGADQPGRRRRPTSPTTRPGHAAALRAGVDSFTDHDDRLRGRPSTGSPRRSTAGLITEADIDRPRGRALAIRFRLGEFDPAERNPYAAHHRGRHQLPGAPAAGPGGGRASRSCCSRTTATLLPLDRGPPRRVAVIGPLADTLLRRLVQRHPAVRGDRLRAAWPSGSATARSSSPRASTGSRCAPTAGRGRRTDRRSALAWRPAPAGAEPASTCSTGATACSRCAAVANGRLPDASATTARSSTTSRGPSGWVVRETFRLAPRRRAARRAAARRQRPVRAVDAGRRAARATRRRRRRPRSPSSWSIDGRGDAAAGGPRGRRRGGRGRQPSAGQRPRDRGPRRPGAAAGPGRRCCGRSTRPTRAPSLVVHEQLPVRDRLGRASTCRRSCGPRTAARSSGTRWPTCSSATPTPAGRLTQTWYRCARRAARPARLRHHRQRRDLPLLPRHPAVPVRPRPELHHASTTPTCG